MERTNTFFGIFGQIVQHSLRYLIRFGRKYQIIAAVYLVVFFVSIIGYANQPATPPPSTPSTPAIPPIPNSPPVPPETPTQLTPPAPPAVKIAQVKAYKNGDSLTIRFDKPVADVQLVVDEQSIAADCKPLICTTTAPTEAMQLQVSWSQDRESFRTNFRL